MCQSCETQISEEILSYLAQHPGAQDTIEGIVGWWLLERRIKHQTVSVKAALAGLIGEGLVIERKGRGARSVYRINRRRMKTIMALLEQRSGECKQT